MRPRSRRGRRNLALVVLVLGLPAYIVVAVTLVAQLRRPPVAVELLIYVGLGVIWALPLRALFRGLSRDEPTSGSDTSPPDRPDDR